MLSSLRFDQGLSRFVEVNSPSMLVVSYLFLINKIDFDMTYFKG